MADVTIKYKGANIATMDASGTKTLNTSGKYCEGDVQVVYADPEKPTQSKTVTPTASGFTVSPDSGKVLSSVVVNGDADLIASNIRSGKNIFGVDGTLVEGITPSGNKALTPSTTAQTNIDVKNYATASVAAITKELLASLDADFVAENIKKDVDLFGLLGTLEGGGGGGVPALSKGVNFIDYDGTVVATWETSTVASKTALPDNPTHDGLTSQGWNWSLADVQNYISSYPDALVIVGQMYITNDGKTRIYIHLEDGRLSPTLGICPNGSVDIDWGDGSAHNTVTGTSVSAIKNTQHTYASGGDYIISLTVTGSMGLGGSSSYGLQLLWKNATPANINRVYQNSIKKVMIGNSVTSIGGYAFAYCCHLASVTIPSSVTSIDGYAFYNCYGLTNATIPSSVTSIGASAFYNCYSLASVTIPSNVTKIDNYAFQYCYSLASVTIPSSVTSIGNNAFQYCYGLTNATIPSSVTKISNYAFNSCYGLTNATIPSSVTSIGGYAFTLCYSLASVTIPSSVTSINGYTFQNCYGLGFIKFTGQTPPTVSSSNAWGGIPSDCIIYVPTGTLSAYTSATNYPSSSTYTYVEY